MLKNHMQIFLADIIDEETGHQYFWYVVARNYESARNRFIKEANRHWYRYAYYLFEQDPEQSAEIIEGFFSGETDIKAGIYER